MCMYQLNGRMTEKFVNNPKTWNYINEGVLKFQNDDELQKNV